MTSGQSSIHARNVIAYWMIGLSIVGIVIISVVVIAVAGTDSRAETTRLVFSSVLPLFGTWVGTVLAFYFARENLQAATDSTVRLTQLVDPKTPVTKVMISRADIRSLASAADETATNQVLLSQISNAMTNGGVRRIPLFLANGQVVYVIHQSTLIAYADSVGKKVSELTQSVADLILSAEYKALVTAIGFAREDAALADVRSAMRSKKDCNDVFVTATGAPDEPVVGWVTNTLLAGVE